MNGISSSVDAGLRWLIEDQAPTGELSSVASPLGPDVDEAWTPDSLKFITALIALACDDVGDERAGLVIDRAVGFLRSEREPHSLWRYWTRASDTFEYTPPDADDTACCSMAVALRGDRTADNIRLLLANRDEHGRFYTWLIPHRTKFAPRYWWAVRDEFRGVTRQRRAELWENSEAWPGDVDGVVNANVIRYLGPAHAPPEAVRWIVDIIRSEREDDCDSWHRNRFTLYSSIADGRRRGITAYDALAPTLVDRIVDRIDDRDGVGPPLDTALALVALHHLDGPPEACDRLVQSLLDRQRADGSWERSVFYFGGPQEVFGWASQALSTATALQALSLRSAS